ncbi:MAG: hypothetical protein ACP5RF_02600 [Candidatus Micrarchaeia archaeon]
MQKLIIISLDMIISLPIIMAVLAAIVYAFQEARAGASEGMLISREINAYTESQVFVSTLIGTNSTFAFANASIKNAFLDIGSASVSNIANAQCSGLCRIITLSGKSYLMVINYENSS